MRRAAFCPLLFESNGGRIVDGRPVGDGARGWCDEPSGCSSCGHFTLDVEWVCPECQTGEHEGYFDSGRCERCGDEVLLLVAQRRA